MSGIPINPSEVIASVGNASSLEATGSTSDTADEGKESLKDSMEKQMGVTGSEYGSSSKDSEHLITITYGVSGGSSDTIKAPIPANFNLDISANWSPKYAMGDSGLISSAARNIGNMGSNTKTGKKIGARLDANSKVMEGIAGGMEMAKDATGFSGTTVKWGTAQLWEGPSPIRCTLPIELIAETDPEKEVLNAIKLMYRMAAPFNVNGLLVAPGPSVVGTEMKTGTKITVRIGNIMYFDNVVVDSVTCDFDTRLSKDEKKILHAKVDFSFITFYAVDQEDVTKMFST